MNLRRRLAATTTGIGLVMASLTSATALTHAADKDPQQPTGLPATSAASPQAEGSATDAMTKASVLRVRTVDQPGPGGTAVFVPYDEIFTICDQESDGWWAVAQLRVVVGDLHPRTYTEYDRNGAKPGCRQLNLAFTEGSPVLLRVCLTKYPDNPRRFVSCSEWKRGQA